jgi:hypothetical protein
MRPTEKRTLLARRWKKAEVVSPGDMWWEMIGLSGRQKGYFIEK